ncbi:hypothetical protein EV182_001163 [Spiromyces aspiralis]|uniref:Uncharacterized protein n=1 Tax=Spiromyces aspiralis TaxID=68401 RepID=A0ACC1HXM7_9FUNG|nr:hypothetical protein EV182_001163 [Spiromyces aspiralis]
MSTQVGAQFTVKDASSARDQQRPTLATHHHKPLAGGAFSHKGPIKNPLLNKHRQQQPFGLASPTDKMLSPVTRKLAEKRRQNISGYKPRSLASEFMAVKAKKVEDKTASIINH